LFDDTPFLASTIKTMSFDAQAYHDQIASQSSFVASTSFCDRVSWQHSTNGLIIVDREEQTPFVGVIAGRVSPFNLKCGTSGNYLKKGLLEKAKYQLHLIRPTDKILGHDFDAAIHNLDEMQKVAGTTGDRRNMIIRDVTGEMLRMVANVFEPRVRNLILSEIVIIFWYRTLVFRTRLTVDEFQMLL
jgi:hypothetical protein